MARNRWFVDPHGDVLDGLGGDDQKTIVRYMKEFFDDPI